MLLFKNPPILLVLQIENFLRSALSGLHYQQMCKLSVCVSTQSYPFTKEENPYFRFCPSSWNMYDTEYVNIFLQK